MASMNEVIENITSSSGSILVVVVVTVLVGGLAILLLLLGIGFWYFKKRWNLKVEIKLARNDGRIIIGEWGKGFYNSKRGVVFIKRGFLQRAIAMKIFDIRKYLQGDNLLTVIQLGPDDYRPVLNDSWTSAVTEYVNDKTGEVQEVKESIMNIKVDSNVDKAWKSAWEAAAKKAYSLVTFFTQFQTPIAIAIVIVALFIGFAILWTRLGMVC